MRGDSEGRKRENEGKKVKEEEKSEGRAYDEKIKKKSKGE